MKLEIELDLNRIDYDAINRQVQEKIDALDIKEMYRLDNLVNLKVKETVEEKVKNHMNGGTWCGLNNDSRREIKDEISKHIRESVTPYVDDVFSKISEDDMNQIISQLLPKILLDLLTENLKSLVSNYYCSTEAHTRNICEDMVHNILRR